ncbi:MAG: selenium metabolism-associated LysR family transcriptional regulator [Desulfobacterales bacterium]
MDLWQLNVFCNVVETRSFSRAGQQVHLSQPTVSSHIKELEQHLDCRLIDRLSKEAAPTKAGEILYRYAKRLLALRAEAESAVAEFLGKMKGTLCIGGSTMPAGYLLPKMIGRFKRDYPDVKVTMRVGDTDSIIRETLDGLIEIGVVGAMPEDPRLEYRRLMEDELRLIVPGKHPWAVRKSVSIQELCAEPLILRESGSGSLKAIQRALKESGVSTRDLNVIAEMGSTEAVYRGVKNGIGVSILSTLAVVEDLQRGELAAPRIENVEIRRGFYLIRDRHRTLSPLAGAFSKCLIEGMAMTANTEPNPLESNQTPLGD